MKPETPSRRERNKCLESKQVHLSTSRSKKQHSSGKVVQGASSGFLVVSTARVVVVFRHCPITHARINIFTMMEYFSSNKVVCRLFNFVNALLKADLCNVRVCCNTAGSTGDDGKLNKYREQCPASCDSGDTPFHEMRVINEMQGS